MDDEQLKTRLQEILPEAEFVTEGVECLNVVVPPEKLHEVSRFVRDETDLQFDFLFLLTAVDWLEYFTVIYHLRSTVHHHTLYLRVNIPDRENPEVDSVHDIWKTAEFHELEAYDLMGIRFRNHPGLRRLFLTEDWVGYPLRKDYVDEINIIEL